MKVDPKTGTRYAHTPEEWAEVLQRHGAGMSLPASVAAHIQAGIMRSRYPRDDVIQESATDDQADED